jgi:hypothetical protein
LVYGIVTKSNPTANPIPSNLRRQLNGVPNSTRKGHGWWPWSQFMEQPLDNWGEYRAWQMMMNGSMKKSFVEKITNLLLVTKDIDL